MARCSYCQKDADRKELKKCSRCQFLLYCSKECQVLSWNTTHKYNCQKPDSPNDTQSLREKRHLTSWLDAWTSSLYSTAIAALDLANHDEDHLVNHCLYIELKKTEHKTDEKRFKVDNLSVVPVEPLRAEYPALSTLCDPPELVGQRVRFLAVVKNGEGEIEQARARVWMDGNIELYRKMDKQSSRTLAEGLMASLTLAVEEGDTSIIPKLWKR